MTFLQSLHESASPSPSSILPGIEKRWLALLQPFWTMTLSMETSDEEAEKKEERHLDPQRL